MAKVKHLEVDTLGGILKIVGHFRMILDVPCILHRDVIDHEQDMQSLWVCSELTTGRSIRHCDTMREAALCAEEYFVRLRDIGNDYKKTIGETQDDTQNKYGRLLNEGIILPHPKGDCCE